MVPEVVLGVVVLGGNGAALSVVVGAGKVVVVVGSGTVLACSVVIGDLVLTEVE